MMLETRTLVLDDDPTFADVLARSLRGTVRNVDKEVDGKCALELFARHRHAVVVLDLIMPEMTGFEVMQRIHQLEPCTQVIIVSGYPSFENAQEAVNRHAFGFLVKPLDVKDLRRTVIAAFALFQERSSGRARDPLASNDAEIETMYREVARLSSALEQSPQDLQLQAAYRDSFARLRSLQARDADLASRAFRNELALPQGMGYSSIEAALRVLGRDKSSA